MKRILATGVLALVASVSEARAFAHLGETVNSDRRTAVERLMTFSNSLNSYRIRHRVFYVEEKRPWLSCSFDCYNTDKCGYGLFVEWLSLKVNGIVYNRILPKTGDIVPYAAADRQGFDIAMNFDGAHAVLRLYMREDSPCLWCEFLPQDFGSDRVREAEVTLTACPSYVDPRGKQKGCARFGGYRRRILTATRTLGETPCKKGTVDAADAWFVFADADYDGSGEDKGKGPCFATADFSGVGTATANVTDAWIPTLTFALKPGAKRLGFGIWESPGVRISNDELCRRVKAEKSAFTFWPADQERKTK